MVSGQGSTFASLTGYLARGRTSIYIGRSGQTEDAAIPYRDDAGPANPAPACGDRTGSDRLLIQPAASMPAVPALVVILPAVHGFVDHFHVEGHALLRR